MVLSMTGFGKSSAEADGFAVDVDIKSVNSRFLEIIPKLPALLQNKEYEIRDLIKARIARGKVTIFISLRSSNAGQGNFNKEKLQDAINQLKEIKKISKLQDKIKLDHILANKELFLVNNVELSDELFDLVKNAINIAVDDLLLTKKKEGKELENDLLDRLSIIENKTLAIKDLTFGSVQEDFNKLKEKVNLLLNDTAVNKERLELELALITEKADITEECVRLQSHIKFFKDTLKNENEPGRKLNFICQELNREANTISAKSISLDIIHNSVKIKEEIEKIREQIQNIE